MFDGLFIVSLIGSLVQGVKEAYKPVIPAENWENADLYCQDMLNGMSAEQRMKNVQNGRYKMEVKYPEPHRDSVSGKIMIENEELYIEDVIKYGSNQAYKWLHQGKYNLNPEEVKKQEEEFKKKMDYLYSLHGL